MSVNTDYASTEEAALVRAAQTGDQAAFEELVARHRDRLYSRAYSMMRREEDALDVMQDAWVKIWQRLDQFHGESGFATWATRVTINVCLDALRKQKRLAAESIERLEDEARGIDPFLPPVRINPTRRLERAELRKCIDQAMEQLSDDHRAVLILHAFEGLEYKEIARRMGCSLGTVMSRLFYARRRLAAVLADVNLDEYR